MLAIDCNDAEALAALFAEDFIFIPKVGQDPIRGRAAILKSTKESAKEENDRAAKDTSGMGRSTWDRATVTCCKIKKRCLKPIDDDSMSKHLSF